MRGRRASILTSGCLTARTGAQPMAMASSRRRVRGDDEASTTIRSTGMAMFWQDEPEGRRCDGRAHAHVTLGGAASCTGRGARQGKGTAPGCAGPRTVTPSRGRAGWPRAAAPWPRVAPRASGLAAPCRPPRASRAGFRERAAGGLAGHRASC
jgi:hypothetical protein